MTGIPIYSINEDDTYDEGSDHTITGELEYKIV